MLVQLLVLSLSLCLSSAGPCHRCATPGLEPIWALTGYPSPVAGFEFVPICALGAGEGVGTTADCPSGCVEMAIPQGSTYQFLRGCHAELAQNNPDLTITAPAVDAATCKTMSIGAMKNIMRTCTKATACNSEITFTANALTEQAGCTVVTTKNCITCSTFDGKGKCSSGDKKNTTSGYMCAKTAGKFSGHDYTERGVTMILPTEKPAPFCMSATGNTTSVTSYFGPITGSSVTRSKRSITQIFSGQTCFCNDADLCNSAPTVVGASFSILLLLSALPFFC